MFERFTKGARHSLFFARLSASEYGSPTVETEHFLLGILHADPNVIGRFLPSKTAKEIRADVDKRIPKQNAYTGIDIQLSNPCKRILAYAVEEADRLFHRHIDVGHFLIGVVREEDGVAGLILRTAGFDLASVREQLARQGDPSER
jgi:ATP-dependent Clp protease ATP-binding subunit ClpC